MKNIQTTVWASVVVLMLAACGSSQNGGNPNPSPNPSPIPAQYDPTQDPFYQQNPSFGAELPPGATRLEPEAFKLKFDQEKGQFVTQADLERIKAEDEKNARKNHRTVEEFVASRPDLNLSSLLLEGPENDFPVSVDGGRAGKEFLLMGRRSRLATVAEGLRTYPSLENLRSVYEISLPMMEEYLTERFRGDYTLEQFGLMPVAEAKNLSAERLRGLNDQLASVAMELGVARYVGNWVRLDPRSPENEIGAKDQLDRSQQGACESHSSRGIYANFEWPLKQYTTSVKSQGARGTCWGFATVAALETTIARAKKRWVNLSEQDFAAHRFLSLSPRPMFEGGDPFYIAQKAWEKGYEFALERDWQYNQSGSRLEVEAPAKSGNWHYEQSCNGFSDTCSDTNHQGNFFCTLIPTRGVYCFWVAKFIAKRSGYVINTEPRQVWDYERTSDYNIAILVLRSIFSGATTLSLDARYMTPDADGFVADMAPSRVFDTNQKKYVDDISLNHVVMLSGYISNEHLRQRLPNALPGAGGGYFVLKNSWGDCWGDAGFAYVPVNWVKKYVGQATAIYE